MFSLSSNEADFEHVDLRSAESANYRIRELIAEATKADSSISLVYRDTLRAMLDLFSGFFTIDSETKVTQVKAVYANPERPIAKLIQETNLILPIISVGQPKTNINTDRLKYYPMIVSEASWDDKTQRAYRVVSLTPKPINIIYTISLWSKYKSDLDQLTEQIHLMFNPGYEIQTNFSNNTKAYLVDESNDSTVNVGDREDRLLRRSFEVEVQTYVPSPKFLMTATGKLEKFNTEIAIVKTI